MVELELLVLSDVGVVSTAVLAEDAGSSLTDRCMGRRFRLAEVPELSGTVQSTGQFSLLSIRSMEQYLCLADALELSGTVRPKGAAHFNEDAKVRYFCGTAFALDRRTGA
jgi:hypothetical protein